MKCDGCGAPAYTVYQGYNLCKRCYSIAEELLPLLQAEFALKYFVRYIDPSVEPLLSQLVSFKEEFAKKRGVETTDAFAEAMKRCSH